MSSLTARPDGTQRSNVSEFYSRALSEDAEDGSKNDPGSPGYSRLSGGAISPDDSVVS